MPQQDCWSNGLTSAGLLAVGSIPVGFFRAHAALKDLSLAEKMHAWNNAKLTGSIMAKPMVTAAAAGMAFSFTKCTVQGYTGQEHLLNSAMGGLAAGVAVALRSSSAANVIKFGSAGAVSMIIMDFLTRIAPDVLGDLRTTGPITITEDPIRARRV